MKRLFVVLFLLTATAQAQRTGGSRSKAIFFDLSLGSASAKIENSNGTVAYYGGISLGTQVVIPVFVYSALQTSLVGSGQYADYKNTASGATTETAKLFGPGVGLELRLLGVVAGYGLNFMSVRHEFSGPSSGKSEYSMQVTDLYVGYIKDFDRLGVGVAYRRSGATVPADKTATGLSAPFHSEIYSLVLRYNTETPFSALFLR